MKRVRFVDVWLGAVACDIALVVGVMLVGGRMEWGLVFVLVSGLATIQGLTIFGIARL